MEFYNDATIDEYNSEIDNESGSEVYEDSDAENSDNETTTKKPIKIAIATADEESDIEPEEEKEFVGGNYDNDEVVDEDKDVDEDDDEDIVDEDQQPREKTHQKVLQVVEEDSDDEDEEDDDYLQKFDNEINKNYIVNFHPECSVNNYDEISALTKIIRNKDNIIVDPLHKTIPFLTKYEKTRVLGQRAKQINSGSKPFVKVPENIIDGYLIAEIELAQKRIPFIIRRPFPSSGCEYWNLKDLEIIDL